MNLDQNPNIAASLDRISKILAGILLKDLQEGEQIKKIMRLAGCGFTNKEIAEMLGTTEATVRVALNREKKKRRVGR